MMNFPNLIRHRLGILFCLLISQIPPLLAQTHLPGEILLQTTCSVNRDFLSPYFQPANPGTLEKVSYEVFPLSEYSHFYHITFDPTRFSEDSLLATFRQQRWVIAAQFNHPIKSRNTTPNDPLFGNQYAMSIIHAPQLWDVMTGGVTACGDTIVVAIVEVGGFDVNHEDLVGNIWHNNHEIPNNGIDDDHNGYIDDMNGWNFTNMNDSFPPDLHGTGVIGVIGAKGNNRKGIAGVNWNVKLMLLGEVNSDAKAVQAYLYARDMRLRYNQTDGKQGAFVVSTNFSGGESGSSPSNEPIWCNVYDTLGMVGILSVSAVDNIGISVEQDGDIPSLCPSAYLLPVTSTNAQDQKVREAAFSAKRVMLGAPGDNVLLTTPGNNYQVNSGTSFAAPLVSGAAALLYSIPTTDLCMEAKTNPVQAAMRIKNDIMNGVDMLPSLQGITVSGGRLNLWNSYQLLTREYGTKIGNWSVLNLYPNPNNQGTIYANLQLPASLSSASIEFINTLGQVVYAQNLSTAELQVSPIAIPLNGLSPGIYFFSLVSTQGIQTARKFVVVH